MWWEEHWAEVVGIAAIALAWGRLSQQMSQATRAIETLAERVGEQNGRVAKNEQAIARLQGELLGLRDNT